MDIPDITTLHVINLTFPRLSQAEVIQEALNTFTAQFYYL